MTSVQNPKLDFHRKQIPSSPSLKFQRGKRVCLICLKRFTDNESINVYSRFLKVVKRHLKIDVKRLEQNGGPLSKNPFCGSCLEKVCKLCDAFSEMHKWKMIFKWRLSEVSESIGKSQQCISYKLGVTLFKTLSVQMGVSNGRFFRGFRNTLKVKCGAEAKSISQIPVVSVDKNSCLDAMKDRLIFPTSQMKQYMQSLIVIFALATPYRKDEEVEAPSKLTREAALVKEEKQNQNDIPELPSATPCSLVETVYYDPDNNTPAGLGYSDDDDPNPSLMDGGDDMDWEPNYEGVDCANTTDSTTFSTSMKGRLRKRKQRTVNYGETAQCQDEDGDVDKKVYEVKGKTEPPTKLRRMSKKKPDVLTAGNFPCNVCSRRFGKKSALECHIQHCHPFVLQYSCDKCPHERFRRKMDLYSHRLKHHQQLPPRGHKRKKTKVFQKSKPYSCTTCRKCFPNQSILDMHTSLLHSPSANYDCLSCGKPFQEYDYLYTHLLNVHETSEVEKPWACHYCYLTFNMEQTFSLHLRMKHVFNFKLSCDVNPCKEKFDAPSELHCHLLNAHASSPDLNQFIEGVNESCKKFLESSINKKVDKEETEEQQMEIFTCKKCKWSFTNRLRLILHQLVHETRLGEKYKCPFCEESHATLAELREHVVDSHGMKEKVYFCVECPTRHSTPEKLSSHTKHVHRKTTPPLQRENPAFACDQCSTETKTKLELMKHKHTAHGVEKSFKCNFEGCTSTFFIQNQLKDHVKKFHSEKKFQCPLCPKKFRLKQYLEGHIKVHKQQKDYVCQFCGRGFVKKTGLDIHVDIHLGNKKWKCAYCDKAFCRKFAMQCHERTHTKEKPFMCKYCGKGFSQHVSMKTHEKIHEKLNSADMIVRRPFQKTIAPADNDNASSQLEESL